MLRQVGTRLVRFPSDSDVHLVFEEEGEGFGAAFYVFRGGPNWNGSNLCAKSPLVPGRISTPNGLRLGLSQSQVEAILGRPSRRSPDSLTYILEAKKKTTVEQLKRLCAQNPALSDREFHEAFDFYYVNSFVDAKFTASKLVHLAVTKSESYP